MIGALFTSQTFVAFLFASLILAVIPGPGVVYLVTRTLGQGRYGGLSSIGGIALGNLGNATAVSLGFAAVLAASATAFLVLKFAGAAYLLFLGAQALLIDSAVKKSSISTNRVSSMRLFRDGFVVALFNPKTALFFAALLPQFINPGVSPLGQSLVLGCVFVAIAVCTDTAYVFAAAALAPAIKAKSRWRPVGRYVTAATFVGLGIYAAISPRPPK